MPVPSPLNETMELAIGSVASQEQRSIALKQIATPGEKRRLNRNVMKIAEGILVTGWLQPITVAPANSSERTRRKYELVTGGDRLEAMRQLGAERIPAVIL